MGFFDSIPDSYVSETIDTHVYPNQSLPEIGGRATELGPDVDQILPEDDPAVVPPPVNAIDPNRTIADELSELRHFISGHAGRGSAEEEKKDRPGDGSIGMAALFMVGAVVLFAWIM